MRSHAASAPAGEAPAQDPDAVVAMERVGKRFGDTWAIRGMDFGIGRGQIVGLIGPSGCGKTTTVRCITGAYQVDEGTALTLGIEPSQLSNRDRQRLGYLPQQPVLFDALNLWENLNFHASLNGVRLRRRSRLREVLELVELAGHEHKKVRESSGGMQRRLALASTLAHDPELVILDEPTAGLDPILRARLWEHFHALAEIGTTLLVTTQYVGEAAHCDLVGLLADGKLLHFATPEELRRAARGGEVLRITTARRLTDEELEVASSLDGVDTPLERESPVEVTGVVDDAGQAIPVLLRWLEECEIGVVDSEEVTIEYEEVFVRLVEAANDDAAPDGSGGQPHRDEAARRDESNDA